MASGQRKAAVIAAVAAAGGLALALIAGYGVGVRVNLTPSLPMGFYRLAVPDERAELVTFCGPAMAGHSLHERGYTSWGTCPDGGAPLMKPIVARPGDVVTVTAAGLAVNGKALPNTAPMPRDAKGRALPAYPAGSYTVGAGDYWVASTYNPGSLDSRYFGPIRAELVTSHLVALATLHNHHQ